MGENDIPDSVLPSYLFGIVIPSFFVLVEEQCLGGRVAKDETGAFRATKKNSRAAL